MAHTAKFRHWCQVKVTNVFPICPALAGCGARQVQERDPPALGGLRARLHPRMARHPDQEEEGHATLDPGNSRFVCISIYPYIYIFMFIYMDR